MSTTTPRIIVRQATLEYRRMVKPQRRPRPQRILSAWDGFLMDLTGIKSVVPVRSSLFKHGHGHAAVCLLVAITINHIRRVVTPSLGQFFWPNALTDMKLAKSSPHQFLEQSASFDWWWLSVWAALAYGSTHLPPFLGSITRETTTWGNRSSAACIVLYLVMSLTWAEHTFVQSCWTLAQVYAYGRLIFRGGAAEHEFLRRLLEERSAQVMATLGLVVAGLHFRVLPVLGQVARGKWAVVLLQLGLVAGTAYMVRYSNKYFLALELSDMFVTLGWIFCAVGMHGMEVLRERTGNTDGVKAGSLQKSKSI